MSLYDRAMAAGWMRFYWYRLVDVAVPLGLALLSVRWFVERKMRVALAIVIAVAAFHAVDCVVLKLFSDSAVCRSAGRWRGLAVGLPVGDRPTGAAAFSPATAGGQAAKLQRLGRCLPLGVGPGTHPAGRSIPRSPHAASTFKWYAGRGEVVNWKETPQDAASLVAWWQRIQDIYCHRQPAAAWKVSTRRWPTPGPRGCEELAKKYEADYLVTQVSVPMLPLQIEYKKRLVRGL